MWEIFGHIFEGLIFILGQSPDIWGGFPTCGYYSCYFGTTLSIYSRPSYADCREFCAIEWNKLQTERMGNDYPA